MNDKELEKIEAMLSGQKRYKLLDTMRLAFLKLPGSCLQVWMTCWLFEQGAQESWLSNETIMEKTGLSRSTVKRARKYLIETGWLVYTGSTAAANYSSPTAGAGQIRTVRVDDPCKGVQNEPGIQIEPGINLNPNGCSCCCTCPCSCLGIEVGLDTTLKLKPECSNESSPTSLRSDERQQQEQKQNQKQEQKSVRVSSSVKWLTKYDSPMPDEFNSWSQDTRTKWCEDHKRKVSVPVEVKPQPKPVVLPVEEKAKIPAPAQVKASVPPTVKVPVPSASLTPPNSAFPPWADLTLEEKEELDELKPYVIPPYQCAHCDATFPGNSKGGNALDKHAVEAHGYKMRRGVLVAP